MRFLYIVILPVLFMLCSCGSASVSESMEEARMALDRDDYRSAKSICDDLRESKTDSISENIGVLCDLSIFYMKIADSAGRDDNMDIAKQCSASILLPHVIITAVLMSTTWLTALCLSRW